MFGIKKSHHKCFLKFVQKNSERTAYILFYCFLFVFFFSFIIALIYEKPTVYAQVNGNSEVSVRVINVEESNKIPENEENIEDEKGSKKLPSTGNHRNETQILIGLILICSTIIIKRKFKKCVEKGEIRKHEKN